MSDWIEWVPSALLAVVGVVLAVAVVRLRSRTRGELGAARAEAADLRHRLDELERRVPRSVEQPADRPVERPAAPEYVVAEVVTSAGPRVTGPTGDGQPVDRRVDGSLFADLVLRESVVKGASFVYGLRRALAPETRNRIRFEMRQEVKRSRRQRRVDLRDARRHLADQRRADESAA